eukprot:1161715-Pelagomonas_calceolata.AAC.12
MHSHLSITKSNHKVTAAPAQAWPAPRAEKSAPFLPRQEWCVNAVSSRTCTGVACSSCREVCTLSSETGM